jgi:hypothetical protein
LLWFALRLLLPLFWLAIKLTHEGFEPFIRYRLS